MAEYIEREAAKRAIMSQYISRANKTEYADVIDAVPAADVVPVRHGRWIEKHWSTEDDWGVINWHSLTCSACGHEERTNGLSPNSIYKYDYCPFCGARIDGEGE